jgi:hypothetical protein
MGSAMIQSGSALQAQQVTASSPHAKAERFDGQSIFRYDTFGDEQLWTGVLRMHEVVAKVSPATALAVGLKVDVDALPAGVVTAIRQHAVNLDDPAVTVALLQLNAVVGVKGTVDESGKPHERRRDLRAVPLERGRLAHARHRSPAGSAGRAAI